MVYCYTKTPGKQASLIATAAYSLKEGRILVLPTDTIYGLSCRADDKAAIKKIFFLKKRDPQTALIVLVSSLAMLKKYVFVSPAQEKIIRGYWRAGERPTTLILRHRGKLPKELTGISDGLAVRLPKNDFLIKILNRVGVPLVSTSLNIKGEEPIVDLKDIADHFPQAGRDIALAIDTGRPRRRKPSRLVDLRDAGQPLILRK